MIVFYVATRGLYKNMYRKRVNIGVWVKTHPPEPPSGVHPNEFVKYFGEHPVDTPTGRVRVREVNTRAANWPGGPRRMLKGRNMVSVAGNPKGCWEERRIAQLEACDDDIIIDLHGCDDGTDYVICDFERADHLVYAMIGHLGLSNRMVSYLPPHINRRNPRYLGLDLCNSSPWKPPVLAEALREFIGHITTYNYEPTPLGASEVDYCHQIPAVYETISPGATTLDLSDQVPTYFDDDVYLRMYAGAEQDITLADALALGLPPRLEPFAAIPDDLAMQLGYPLGTVTCGADTTVAHRNDTGYYAEVLTPYGGVTIVGPTPRGS